MPSASPLPSSTDVVIVGAGPTGLTTACLLLQRGINAIILDAAPGPATTSRAAIIHIRTLEILDKLDLAEPVIAQGVPIKDLRTWARSKPLAKVPLTGLHERFNHAVALPQTETERLLTEKLQSLGGQVHRNYTVTEVLHNDTTGVKLRISHPSSDTSGVISSNYVVAADGSHSKLRQNLAIPFEGSPYDDLLFLTADIHMAPSVWPHQHLRNSISLYLHPTGFLLVVPFPSTDGNLWRVIAPISTETPAHPDTPFLDRLLTSRGPFTSNNTPPSPPQPITTQILWSNHFRISHRLATSFRQNRVFLAGDAAHTHSPAGGQGMNIGIQDASELADVLAAALLNGKEDVADLDRYEAARRPVAERVIKMTHRMTVAMTLRKPWLCWVRNWLLWLFARVMPGGLGAVARRVSGLDRRT